MPPNGKPLIQRVSRYELAHNPYVWLATAGTFALLGVAILAISVLPLGYDAPRLQALTVYLLIVAIAFWRTKPPAVDSPFNHVALATIYVSIAIGMAAFQPEGVVVVTSAMFIASLVAFRLVDRRQIAIHNLLAGIALAAPVVAGITDVPTTLAVSTLVPATWVLSACVALVLEAAEAQGNELEQLVRRDPLTGAGNRRMLEERLRDELNRHERARRPLSVIALDLDGFKALNDEVGHAAGDRLLCHVADALTAASAARQGVVIRQGGDEFCVILPETDVAAAAQTAGEIERHLGDLNIEGVTITTGLGAATYPTDAVHRGVLLDVADERLRDHKSHRSRLQALPATAFGRRPAIVPEPAPRDVTEQSRPMSRRTIALSETIWRITGAVWAFQLLYLAAFAVYFELLTPSSLALGAVCSATAIWIFRSRPAPIGSPANAIVLGVMIVTVLFGLLTPMSGGILGASVFVAPLTAVRLDDRRQIAGAIGLYTAACFTLGALSVVGILTLVEPAIGLALVTQALVTPILAFSVAVVLEAAEAQGVALEQVARRDPLTGAGNRRMLFEILDDALSRQDVQPTGLVVVDLNGFKPLNDVHGHAAGDQLLREVVASMSRAIGSAQTVIRLGGDEFCVVIDDASDATLTWTEHALRTAITEVQTPDGPLTAGIGSALYPRDADDRDGLLDAADERMRETKLSERVSPLRAVQ